VCSPDFREDSQRIDLARLGLRKSAAELTPAERALLERFPG
jgi:hypothetical protein